MTGVIARRRAVSGFAIFTLVMVAVFTGLGIWQLQRRVEKHALIAILNERLAVPPGALPAPSQWKALTPAKDEFRRVSFTATYAPLPDAIPGDLGALLAIVTQAYLPYLEANAQAFAQSGKRVRYEALGASYEEPTKPYRVWCRDRLRAQLVRLEPAERRAVEKALAAPEALARLATPSPKPAEDPVGALPIPSASERDPVDSWWRRR